MHLGVDSEDDSFGEVDYEYDTDIYLMALYNRHEAMKIMEPNHYWQRFKDGGLYDFL